MIFSMQLGKVLICRQCNRIVRCSSSYSFDPYKILEVPPNATKETVKSAYFRLVKKYHPDRNPSDESAKLKFENVQNAYRYLMEQIAQTSDDPEDKPYDFTISPLGVETHPVPTWRDAKSYRNAWYIIVLVLLAPFVSPLVYEYVRRHLPDRTPTLRDQVKTMQKDIRFRKIIQKQHQDMGSELNNTLSSFRR